jgi:hypothetical protein
MSSASEQASDKVVGLSRPVTFAEDIKIIEAGDGTQYDVTDNLLVIRLLKQRMGSPSHTFHVYFNPATFVMAQAQPRGQTW